MSEVKIITANSAAAIAASLCKVQVVAAYPITPQTLSQRTWPLWSRLAS